MDGYQDQDMGDIILGELFCKASCVEARRFNGLITIHNGSDNVTYQMARSHPRIEAIRIFLAFASYMGFIVYQMDVKSALLYGIIYEEVYMSQPLGFVDPKFPKKVYKVVKALYGLHQAPKAWYATLSTFLLKSRYRRGTIVKTLFIKKDKNDIMLVQVYVDDIIFRSTKRSWCDEFEALMKSRFQMSSMGELTFFLGLQVKQKEDGIFISHDKYVAEILKKFYFASVKTASTLIETHKSLTKDEEAADVDEHLYRSMIGSLIYLTASRPNIMFTVYACSRFQVTPKTLHLHVIKRIFRYLKGKPKLGLWYPRVSSFDLESYSDSDYAGANLDRKSTTRGCQFLSRRLISWQCKKRTIVATSTTEAEYVATANYYGQVLWIQNQMLDYGFNFINTKIYIDNERTICIVKNPLFHSKTKHIEIRHHFIRDAYEKKLIQVLKIHTDDNVADLLTKAFNVSSSQTVNDEKQIHATVDSKAVVVTEASLRSSLLLNVADDTACLTNEAIFQNLALMGISTNIASAVICLATNQQFNFSKLIFDGMLRNLDNPKKKFIISRGGGRVLALETAKDAQAAKILKLKTRINKLEKKCKPGISHHRAWLKSVKRLSMKKRLGQKEPVSKQGRKNVKPGPTLDAFDDLDADLAYGMDYMDTKEAVTEGRQSKETEEQNVTDDTKVLEKENQGEEQIPRDAEIALKVQAELDDEDRLERQRQEKAYLNYIANLYDEVQARIDAGHELAVRWTQEEQEKFTVDERAKLLEHKKIADFVPIGSEEDERLIQKMNKKVAGVHEEKGSEEPDNMEQSASTTGSLDLMKVLDGLKTFFKDGENVDRLGTSVAGVFGRYTVNALIGLEAV
ncbi:putative ribonuclease H-like domain-containing protein, partial [Tanacetum coccineum]